jgi:hypothetical protein
MLKNNRIGGVVSLVIGVGLIVLNWYLASHEGKFYIALCFVGPVLAAYGLGIVIFTPQKLFRTREEVREDGERVVHTDNNQLTALGWLITLVGLALGGLMIAGFKMGWFI